MKKHILSEKDMVEIRNAVDKIDEDRREDMKSSRTVNLSCGSAKVYHMGINNPVVRVDIKIQD